MKSEARTLVDALVRCLKTQSNFETTCKLTDKLKKQIAAIKTSDEQRDHALQLINEINDRGRETAELRAEHEALKKLNREQRKQLQQSSSPKDTQKIQELQAATQDLKATVAELKEKKHRVEMQLKEKERVSAALEQKYKSLVALMSQATRSGSKIDSTGPLPRQCDVEYLEKHLATLQHCKELDDKNHASMIHGAVSRLRENKNKVAKLEADLEKKKEEIRSNAAHLRHLKAHHRQHDPTLPPILEQKKLMKQVRVVEQAQSICAAERERSARGASTGQAIPNVDHDVVPHVPHDTCTLGNTGADNATSIITTTADPPQAVPKASRALRATVPSADTTQVAQVASRIPKATTTMGPSAGSTQVAAKIPRASRTTALRADTTQVASRASTATASSADPRPVALRAPGAADAPGTADVSGAADADDMASLGGVRIPAGDAPRAPSRKTYALKQQGRKVNNPTLAKEMAAEYVSQLVRKCIG